MRKVVKSDTDPRNLYVRRQNMGTKNKVIVSTLYEVVSSGTRWPGNRIDPYRAGHSKVRT